MLIIGRFCLWNASPVILQSSVKKAFTTSLYGENIDFVTTWIYNHPFFFVIVNQIILILLQHPQYYFIKSCQTYPSVCPILQTVRCSQLNYLPYELNNSMKFELSEQCRSYISLNTFILLWPLKKILTLYNVYNQNYASDLLIKAAVWYRFYCNS